MSARGELLDRSQHAALREHDRQSIPRARVGIPDGCRTESDLLCLTWPTVMGYLRMVTHAAIVSPPLSPSCALENVESILRLPHVRMLREEEGFWDLYREVTRGIAVRGKLVPDAHLATILRQHGVTTLFTNDRDFRLFDFLDVRNPLA